MKVLKVLIAEDHPAIRMLHHRLLTNWGYNVDLAANGREAVERVHKSGEKGAVNYDLCLMDVNMPVMNGIEAIQAIRQNTTYLPVIAYSASLDNKMPCLEAGADEFLLKPLPATELKETLEEFAVKQNILYLDGENLSMRQAGPADSEELTELRMLDKKGVAKFTVVDISFRFLAHKNTQNKLFDDFSEGGFQLSKILECTCQERDLIQTRTSRAWLKKMKLTSEQLQKQVTKEDKILKKYERS